MKINNNYKIKNIYLLGIVLSIFALLAFANRSKIVRHLNWRANQIHYYHNTAGQVWGIDISHHQSNIDWNKLVKHNKPEFVFLTMY